MSQTAEVLLSTSSPDSSFISPTVRGSSAFVLNSSTGEILVVDTQRQSGEKKGEVYDCVEGQPVGITFPEGGEAVYIADTTHKVWSILNLQRGRLKCTSHIYFFCYTFRLF